MNIAQIESNLQEVIKSISSESFIYDLLLAYGQPKATISRLQKGGLNISKIVGEILWRKKLLFKSAATNQLYQTIDHIKHKPETLKYNPRFIIVTDYQQLLAIDTKNGDSLDIKLNEIAKHFDFFLPWAGMEKAQYQGENPADVKAAYKMAKLFDQIKKDNPNQTAEQLHSLNVFLSRVLFCFFAEDTGIFADKQFTSAISSYTQPDGSDLHDYLDKLFTAMNTQEHKELPVYLGTFPYVNGGLFGDTHSAPQFTRSYS